MTTTALARCCPVMQQPSEMTLDICLLQIRLAELAVFSWYWSLSHAMLPIGTAELTTVTRLEQVILFARAMQQAIKRACRAVEPRAVVPWVICDTASEYVEAWTEIQALIDDLILYTEAYQDVLRDQELSYPGECHQRQVRLRTQHVHLLRALLKGIHRIAEWKANVRQDDTEQRAEVDEDFDDDSFMEGGSRYEYTFA